MDRNIFPTNWHGARCGHNFLVLECPYRGCLAGELYDALAALVGAVDFDQHPEDFAPDWHKARAALAKAEQGESS